MAGKAADIQLLFGVKGGGSVDVDSGKQIKEDLQKIIDTLNNQGVYKIRVGIDENSLNDIKSQISKAFQSLSSIDIGKTVSARTSAGGASVADTTSNFIKDDTAKLLQVLSQIETAKHSVDSAIQKALQFNSGVGTEEYVSKLSGLSDSYRALVGYAMDGDMTQKSFTESFRALGLSAKYAKDGLDEYISKEKTLDKHIKDSMQGIAALTEGTTKYDQANKKIVQSLQDITRVKNAANASGAGISGSEIASLDKYTEKLNSLYSKLKNGALSQEEFNKSIREVQDGIDKASAAVSSYQSPLDRLKNSVSGVTKEFIGFYSAHQLVSKGIAVLKDMVNQSIELENAFADTRIVTHATKEELKSYADSVADSAQRLSVPMESLISATTTYARLGYNLKDSSTLAEFTGMLEKVGDIDTESAEQSITAILKAFPDDASITNIESVMDRLVKTGNNFPISVKEIAEGMTNASSALSAAGNSFDQSVAMLAAANSTVQDAAKSSTALRTIAARIRGTKAELDDLGEVMTTAKREGLVQMLTDHKVALTDINHEYRSTYDIMKDIAAQWDEMSSMERAALAESIAGNRQQTVFYSLIENFQEAENAMESMADSAGTLSDSYEIYLNTTQAHIEEFKVTWQTLSMDLVNSDMVQKIIDIGSATLRVGDALAKANALIPTIIASINAIKALKFLKSLNSSRAAVDAIVASMLKEGTVTKSLELDFAALTSAERQATVAKLQLAAADGNEAAAATLEALGVETLTAAETGATVATNTLNVSIKGLLASNPLGWIMLAVSGIISLVSWLSATNDEVKSTDESIATLKQDLSDISEASNSSASNLRSLLQESNNVIPRFVELSKGVDQFGRNVSLSDEEFSEFIELNNKIAEMFPELNSGYDKNGNAILSLSYTADTLAESLWNAVEAQRALANFDIANNMDDAISKANDLDKANERKLESINSVLTSIDDITAALDTGQFGSINPNGVIDSLRAESEDFDEFLNNLGYIGAGLDLFSVDRDVFDKAKVYLQKIIGDTVAQLEDDSEWNAVKQTAIAWIQGTTEYLSYSENIQDIVLQMVSGVDYGQVGAENAAQLQDYLREYVLNVIKDAGTEGQAAMQEIVDIGSAFKSGEVNATQYQIKLVDISKRISDALRSSGMSAEDASDAVSRFLDILGADDENEKINTVVHSIDGSIEKAREFVDTLNADEITFLYKIVADGSGLTIDEATNKIEEFRNQIGLTSDAIETSADISDLFKNVKSFSSNIDKAVTAMKKLENGTALTTKELVTMAETYPELLAQSELFTDGSIEGQRRLLETVIETNKERVRDTIQSRMKELQASLVATQREMAAKMTAAISARDLGSGEYSIADAVSAAKATQDLSIQINNLQALMDSVLNGALAEVESMEASVSKSSSSSGSSSSSSSSSKNDPIADWYKVKGLLGTDYAADHMDEVQFNYELKAKVEEAIANGTMTPEDAAKYISEYTKAIEKFTSDAKKAIDNLVQYRVKALKSALEDQKKQLNEQLSALKEFYDKQKSLLKDQLNEEKYLEEQAEKRKSVSDLESQISQLQNDNSAWARKRTVELQSKLADANKELSDFERDHSVEASEAFFDKQYEAQAANIQSAIDKIDTQLNDPNALYNQALSDIRSNSVDIYNELKAYGEATSTDGTNTFVELWDAARSAIDAYQKWQNLQNGTYYQPGTYSAAPWLWGYTSGFNGMTLSPYASGTPSATAGMHRVDELGSEMVFRSANGSRYRILSDGDKVLTADATSFLYNFANSKGGNLLDDMRKQGSYNNVTNNGGAITVYAGDIIINGNATSQTKSELRRAQDEQIHNILSYMQKLKR